MNFLLEKTLFLGPGSLHLGLKSQLVQLGSLKVEFLG